jgi:S-adenosylmethionine uptake transporter
MLGAMFLFSAADMLAKLLTDAFHPVQIIWFRQLALFIGVLILLSRTGTSVLHSRRPGLQITRGVLAVGSGIFFVTAVKYVPLADAVATTFVAPFFLTILGVVILGEQVGVRRWSAVVVGFIGALIIIRPGMGVIHPASMLIVAAAAFYASRQVIGRLLADSDRTVTTVAYTALTASFLITLPLPFIWVTPQATHQWLTLIAMALLAGVGEVMVIKALEVAEAAVVPPMHYTLIIWGTAYGYLVFGQLPDQWTWLGTLIIVAAGIYTLQRDRIKRS